MSRDNLKRVANEVGNPRYKKEMLWTHGKVTAIKTNPNRIDVRLNHSGEVEPDIRYMDSYSPVVDDRVWLLTLGADMIALGRLA